jgi:hypothetical protein
VATLFHQTARKMQPVAEIGGGRAKAYGKLGKHEGQTAYGRGDVQLTWDFNYQRADDQLELKGALTSNYDRAMETAISAAIMVLGMAEGWFTGRASPATCGQGCRHARAVHLGASDHQWRRPGRVGRRLRDDVPGGAGRRPLGMISSPSETCRI